LWGTVVMVPLPFAVMYFRRFLKLAYDPVLDSVPYDGEMNEIVGLFEKRRV
jgi:hypothetical protein